MKKWQVTIECTIQAETREEVWEIGRELIDKHLRGLASVASVELGPIPNPEQWIAVNEPIKPIKPIWEQ